MYKSLDHDIISMIFISHSSKDKAAALNIQQRLLGYGYDASQLFLDSDAKTGIPAGSKWEQVLYAHLKDCRALIVLCSANWQESRWCFAELVFAKAMGKEIFPVLLQECSIDHVGEEHQAVFVYKEGDAAYTRLWDGLDSRHLGPRDDFGWPPKDGDHCPFPGLFAFDERLAGVYFGREAETQTILEDLRKMRANGEPRLLMIVGGSGSGKSSLLNAGVLPRLKHKTADTKWVVLPTLRANEQRTMFEQLTVNVVELFPKDAKSTPDWKLLRTRLISDDVKQAVNVCLETFQELTLARNRSDATVLIAIDQFEELLAPSAGLMAGQFLRFLRELLHCRNGHLLVIGTMRSDYLDIYEQSSDALQAPFFQPWRLGPFPSDRIEEVIRKPANRAHVEITDELVERLKRDTPTVEALPLLAFTLEKLYRGYASDGKLELQDYESLGGMEGSIQKCIGRIVPPNSLSASDAAALRLTFVKHLAQVNDKGAVVRLRARWDDLPAAAKPILEKFVNERLLIRSENKDEEKPERRSVSIEVAHEAMFRCWSDLEEWLRASARILRWRRDVRRDRANDPKWTGLRPAQLAVSRDWPKRRRDELTGEEVDWINRGILWERIRRGIAATIVIVVALLAGIAWWQRNEAINQKQEAQVAKAEKEKQRQEAVTAKNDAERRRQEAEVAKAEAEEQARIANVRRLAAESQATVDQFPQRSLLLAVEAVHAAKQIREGRMFVAERALRDALAHTGGREVGRAGGAITAIAISRDDQSRPRWMVAGSEDNTIMLWNLSGGQPLGAPRAWRAHDGPIRSVAISTDNHWLVTGGEDQTARIWDLTAVHPELSSKQPLRQHGPVTGLAISSDSQILVTSGTGDNTVTVWKLSSENAVEPVRPPLDHPRPVRALAINSDNSRLVTGDEDGAVRIWDLTRSDARAEELHDHHEAITAVAISPDKHWLLTGSKDTTVRLWDLQASQPEASSRIMFQHAEFVHAVAISPDGRWAFSGSGDATVCRWSLEAGDLQASLVVLPGHRKAVEALAVSPDSKWLVSASADQTARIWNNSCFQPALTSVVLHGHQGPLRAVAISPDSRWLVTGSEDHTVRVWDLSPEAGEERLKDPQTTPERLRGNNGQIFAVAMSGDNRLIATGGEDGIVGGMTRLWERDPTDLRQKARPKELPGSKASGKIKAVAISPDDRWLISGGEDSFVRVWDLKTEPIGNPVRLAGSITALAISPDGHWLVTGSEDRKARIYDLTGKGLAAPPVVLPGHKGAITALAISSDSHRLVTTSDDKTAWIWDLTAKDPATDPVALHGHKGAIKALAISANGHWLATGSDDKTARIWDLTAKDPEQASKELSDHEKPVTSVAISPDNRWLVTGSEDKTARLWDLTNQRAAAKILPGHINTISCVAISADNRWVVTASYDSTCRLWDLKAEDPSADPVILSGQEGINALVISRDSRYLLTGFSYTYDAWLWLLQTDDLINLAGSTAGRNFFNSEWESPFSR
jgi:WD40 repeat protein